MARSDRPAGDRTRTRSRLAALAYTAAWLVAATVIVGVLLLVLDGDEPDAVSVPPVHETDLEQAASRAECELRRARGRERLNPAVIGGFAASPARPGFYDEPLDESALLAAQREGLVVIHFRDLDDSDVDMLRTLQEAAPDGTIVAPNGSGMPFAVAVTAYRRLLGCHELDEPSVDAIQLFRGRFVGSGPG